MASGAIKKVRGAFEGTGALLDIRTVGFRPRSVKLFNVSDGVEAVWLESMPDDAMAKRVAAGTGSYVTSAGITPLSDGFRLGADSDVNAAGEEIHFEATE